MQAEVKDIVEELNAYQQELCERLGHEPVSRQEQIETMLRNFLVCGDAHINIEAVMALKNHGIDVKHARCQLDDGKGGWSPILQAVVNHGKKVFSFECEAAMPKAA